MNHNRRLLLATLLITISLLLGACRGGDKKEPTSTPLSTGATSQQATNTPAPKPTDTPAPPPTDTPVPQPTATPEPQPTDTPEPESTEAPPAAATSSSSDIASITEVLDSYRSRGALETKITFPDGQEEAQNVTFNIDWVSTDGPFGGDISMVMSGFDTLQEGQEGMPSSIAMYAIGDNMLMQFGDQWVTSPRDGTEIEQMPGFFGNPDELIKDLSSLNRVGDETVSGVQTVHYSFDEAPFINDFLNAGQDLKLGDNVQVQGDIWVAKDDNYVVKFEWSVTGQGIKDTDSEGNEILTDVSMHWFFEIYDVNDLDAIALPEGAPQPGAIEVPGFAPGEFPVPPDTDLESSFGGMISLQSTLSEEEITAFYEEQLAALGWDKQEGFLPSWTKDGVTLNILVTPDDSGATSVIIMAE